MSMYTFINIRLWYMTRHKVCNINWLRYNVQLLMTIHPFLTCIDNQQLSYGAAYIICGSLSKVNFQTTLICRCIHRNLNIVNNKSGAIVAVLWWQCTHNVCTCLVYQPMRYSSCTVVGARKEGIITTDCCSVLWLADKSHTMSCRVNVIMVLTIFLCDITWTVNSNSLGWTRGGRT